MYCLNTTTASRASKLKMPQTLWIAHTQNSITLNARITPPLCDSSMKDIYVQYNLRFSAESNQVSTSLAIQSRILLQPLSFFPCSFQQQSLHITNVLYQIRTERREHCNSKITRAFERVGRIAKSK